MSKFLQFVFSISVFLSLTLINTGVICLVSAQKTQCFNVWFTPRRRRKNILRKVWYNNLRLVTGTRNYQPFQTHCPQSLQRHIPYIPYHTQLPLPDSYPTSPPSLATPATPHSLQPLSYLHPLPFYIPSGSIPHLTPNSPTGSHPLLPMLLHPISCHTYFTPSPTTPTLYQTSSLTTTAPFLIATSSCTFYPLLTQLHPMPYHTYYTPSLAIPATTHPLHCLSSLHPRHSISL